MLEQMAKRAQEILENGEANKIDGAIIQVCENIGFDDVLQMTSDEDNINYINTCKREQNLEYGIKQVRSMAEDILRAYIRRQEMIAKRAALKAARGQ